MEYNFIWDLKWEKFKTLQAGAKKITVNYVANFKTPSGKEASYKIYPAKDYYIVYMSLNGETITQKEALYLKDAKNFALHNARTIL